MSTTFEKALTLIDAENAQDPNVELVDGRPAPKELVYSKRMSDTLAAFRPEASEALRLAARAQHIKRWAIPRSNYPNGKKGYLAWRRTLAEFHAEKTGELLLRAGYDEATAERVEELIQKKNLKSDPEAQTLEDVICLVFLKHYFAPFMKKHDEAKIVRILRKTWAKMSDEGREAALDLPLPEGARSVVEKAVGTP